jgi:RNA polymerase sigma factor (sigma-70 family)
MILAPDVFVVHHDSGVRSSLELLVGTVGLRAEIFDSAETFLHREPPRVASCLVLGVRMRGMSGLDCQRELAARNIRIPVIFVSSYDDVRTCVRAMKAGAVEFFTRPFNDQDLLDAIRVALEQDRARRQQEEEIAELQKRFGSLSPRERQVVCFVVSGMLNKQIAGQLGTAENTIKVHRARAIEKMQAQSLADLVKMIEKIKLHWHNAA